MKWLNILQQDHRLLIFLCTPILNDWGSILPMPLSKKKKKTYVTKDMTKMISAVRTCRSQARAAKTYPELTGQAAVSEQELIPHWFLY